MKKSRHDEMHPRYEQSQILFKDKMVLAKTVTSTNSLESTIYLKKMKNQFQLSQRINHQIELSLARLRLKHVSLNLTQLHSWCFNTIFEMSRVKISS